MTVYHTGIETGCDPAMKEREGMPPSFKEHGYFQPSSRANLMIVRDHLQNALHAGLNSEAMRYVVMAIKELERD